MTEDEKLAKIRERFPEIVGRINEEKITDYKKVTDREKKFFAEIFEFVKEHDKTLFLQLFEAVGSGTNEIEQVSKAKEAACGFNLKTHLLTEYVSLLGRNGDFFREVERENVEYGPTMENLYVNYRYLPAERVEGYEQTANEVLQKIVSSSGKANKVLKEKLDGVCVKFGIYAGDKMDGKCQYDGEAKTLLISLSEGCFTKHRDALGMVMCHELGHFVDASGRPDGYLGKMGCSQEFFADAVGYKMASASGLEIEHYKNENRRAGTFFAARMDKIENLQVMDRARRSFGQHTLGQ